MRLVLQRAIGDCGLAALATLIEQSYEDVYLSAERVDRKRRGKSGIHMASLITIAKRAGVTLAHKRAYSLDEDEGLLAVTWLKPHAHPFDAHLVAVGHGVIVDPADGVILPADEYLARYKGVAGSFVELR